MDSLTQMTEDQEFSAISEPDFDFDSVQMPDDGPMVFEFDIEVRPEFDLPALEGAEDRAADARIHRRRSPRASQPPALAIRHDGTDEGPIKPGHFVTITLRASRDGQQLSQLTEETIEVKPTLSFTDAKLEGFDKLLIGKKAGDTVQTKLTISPDSENEESPRQRSRSVAGNCRRRRTEAARVDAGFLDRIGGFKDEAELKTEVRKEIERQLKYQQQQRVRQQITGQLTVAATWELPQDLLRRQARRELDRAVMELQSSGFSNDADPHLHERVAAERAVRPPPGPSRSTSSWSGSPRTRRSRPRRRITTTKSS